MSPLDLRGRHAQAAPATPAGFVCPACGANNAGRLEDGCASCGNGGGARHVGIDPPARRSPTISEETRAEIPSVAAFVDTLMERFVAPPEPALTTAPEDLAFAAWSAQHPERRSIAQFEAFVAGWHAAFSAQIRNRSQEKVVKPIAIDDEETGPIPPALAGTAESRTIIVALQRLLDQVYVEARIEEVESGEWLSRAEIERLIVVMGRG